jgi:hypothetical protein
MTDADQIELSGTGFPNQLEVSSDWLFMSVAIQKHPAKNENDCWFKKDETADWQRIENTDGFWSLFGPLLGIRGYGEPGTRASSKTRRSKSRKWPVAKILCGIAVLAVASAGGIYRDAIVKGARELLTSTSGTEFSADIEQGLVKAVVGMRAELPKRIDATTTLMWVSYSGTKMIYDNRLDIEGSKVDDSTKKKLGQLITVNTCASTASRKLLDLGGSYRYVYSDIHAKIVTTVEISKEQCS